MKKILILSSAVLVIVASCKSKKTAGSANTTNMVSDDHLTAVQARFPDATKEELQKGYSVYTGVCTKCHAAKNVTVYSEPKLLEIVDVMAKKAKISVEEKQALIRFAVGVRATSK